MGLADARGEVGRRRPTPGLGESREVAAGPLSGVGAQQPQSARLDRADRARPRGDGRGRRLGRRDGGRGRGHRPQLIVCPILKKLIPESIWAKHRCLVVHPGPMGDRGTVVAGLGDRARHARVGRDGPRGERRGRRRRRLGHAPLPDARGRQEQPVPPRGPPCRDRGARRGDGQDRRRRRAPDAADLGERAGDRPGPRADEPGRPRDRLAVGPHRARRPQDPGRRGPPRGARRRSRARSSTSSASTASGRCAAGPGEIIAQRPGAICRATVDGAVWITHLSARHADGDVLQAPRDAGAHASRPPVHASGIAGPVHDWPPSTPFARSPTRSTPASATCTSTSTTGR